MTTAGHPVSRTTMGKLLHQMKYAPKANARQTEACSASPEQRNAQFDRIGEQRAQFTATGDPIISVDTKKKN